MLSELLCALEETGQLDNTYVVLSSDNGVMVGQMGINGKGVPYDGVTHIPLLIRGPGIPANETTDGLVGLHDLAPTFAQWGGAEPPPQADGRSLSSLIAGWPLRDA
jgi:arylsulfatase A-like enzyme